MEVLYPHCAGLDVHKDTVVACVRHMVDGAVKRAVRTFKTTTKELLALSEWLAAEGCTYIAMEATGVYWKPMWHIPFSRRQHQRNDREQRPHAAEADQPYSAELGARWKPGELILHEIQFGGPPLRDRWFADSLLEGAGFEPSVPP
jgi:Transposase